jgi:DNA-binding NtrC family response regulator
MLHVKYPKTPLIVISGYFCETMGGAILDGTAHFMQKPIKPAALIEMVRGLLLTSKLLRQRQRPPRPSYSV